MHVRSNGFILDSKLSFPRQITWGGGRGGGYHSKFMHRGKGFDLHH